MGPLMRVLWRCSALTITLRPLLTHLEDFLNSQRGTPHATTLSALARERRRPSRSWECLDLCRASCTAAEPAIREFAPRNRTGRPHVNDRARPSPACPHSMGAIDGLIVVVDCSETMAAPEALRNDTWWAACRSFLMRRRMDCRARRMRVPHSPGGDHHLSSHSLRSQSFWCRKTLKWRSSVTSV